MTTEEIKEYEELGQLEELRAEICLLPSSGTSLDGTVAFVTGWGYEVNAFVYTARKKLVFSWQEILRAYDSEKKSLELKSENSKVNLPLEESYNIEDYQQ